MLKHLSTVLYNKYNHSKCTWFCGRSPAELLKEIILVDDGSFMKHLQADAAYNYPWVLRTK
jgi:hypothetical protein